MKTWHKIILGDFHAMRRKILIVLLMLLSGCIKQIALTDKEAQFILLPEDFPGNTFDGFNKIRYTSGKDYTFSHGKTPGKEESMLYGRGYYTPTKKRASYRVNIIIRNSESRAEFEYNRNIMLLDKIHKSYLVTIDPKLYKADKIFCIEKTDYFYLVIKRKLYVYIVTLDNIPAHEGDIRSILQIKLNNLDESLRLGQST